MKRQFIFLFTLISLTQITSCSQLLFNQSEFSDLDSRAEYFSPHNDFPVVSGDSSQDWNEERAERKITRNDFDEDKNESRQLHDELASLESKESGRSYDFYQKYKYKMDSVSERIYFLKLSHMDRKSFLENKGYLEEDPERIQASEVRFGLRMSDLNQSMTKEDVLESWGRPLKVEVAGNPSLENERWLYDMHGAMKFVYFESGYVAGLE